VNKYIFKDSLVLEQVVSESIKSDAAEMLRRDRNPKLIVEIDATHSGTLINQRVYPGKQVQAAYKSFFSKDKGGSANYDKPILKHHHSEDDAIGRVTSAKFTQLKYGDYFENDYLAPEITGGKGSGIVTVSGFITDPDSIRKIVDSRFLSVSAGHSSQMLLCSVCGDSLFECPHLPGQKYNEQEEVVGADEQGSQCYGITAGMVYNEVSFVNHPASPSAKLVNFNWADNKGSWKKDTIIASQVSGKKEAVRNFILRDDDGDLSLLSGDHKSSTKKTVIAVSPVIADKLKHVMSSEKPSSSDETIEVRLATTGSDSKASNVEQNLDKANDLDKQSNEDSNMEKELEVLKNEIASLKDGLTTAKTEVETLKKQNEAKDSQIQRLTTDAAAIQNKMSKTLAVSLASIRARLKKTGNDSVDSKEKFDAYVEKLSTRSIDSLQDSLQDLMLELESIEIPTKQITTSTTELVAGDKVTGTVPAKSTDGKPVVKPNDKVAKNGTMRSVDKLSLGLGLEDK